MSSVGIPLLFSSRWGGVLMAMFALSLLLRIRIEEEMMLEAFGDTYREYRERTKMIIPYIFCVGGSH